MGRRSPAFFFALQAFAWSCRQETMGCCQDGNVLGCIVGFMSLGSVFFL